MADDGDTLAIQVADLENDESSFLVALHELVEVVLCQQHGITAEQVDAYDFAHQDDDDPGLNPDAPYHREHMVAFSMEIEAALALGVDWTDYNKRLDEAWEQIPEKRGTPMTRDRMMIAGVEVLSSDIDDQSREVLDIVGMVVDCGGDLDAVLERSSRCSNLGRTDPSAAAIENGVSPEDRATVPCAVDCRGTGVFSTSEPRRGGGDMPVLIAPILSAAFTEIAKWLGEAVGPEWPALASKAVAAVISYLLVNQTNLHIPGTAIPGIQALQGPITALLVAVGSFFIHDAVTAVTRWAAILQPPAPKLAIAIKSSKPGASA